MNELKPYDCNGTQCNIILLVFKNDRRFGKYGQRLNKYWTNPTKNRIIAFQLLYHQTIKIAEN